MTPERRAKLKGDLFRLASHEQTNEHVARMAFEKYESVCREDRSRPALQWSEGLRRAIPLRLRPRGLTFTPPAPAAPRRAPADAAMFSEPPRAIDVVRFAWVLVTIIAAAVWLLLQEARQRS